MPASNLENASFRPPTLERANPPAPVAERQKHHLIRPGWGFLLFAVGLVSAFYRPLLDLLRYSSDSDVFSYIPLVPVMSGYLVWLKRKELAPLTDGSRKSVWVPFLVGAAILIGGLAGPSLGWKLAASSQLSLFTLAFLLFLVGGCVLFFGGGLIRAAGFPMALLLLMIPLPPPVTEGFSRFLQHTSAEVSYLLLKGAGEPVLRQGLVFHLPGITPIEVAEECSGIRSSLVLFITSLLAGYLFLARPRYRLILALAAIPLGILRNGLRIFLLSMLCVHVDPEMIHSPLHSRGGPVFFALSMLLFLALLVVLRKFERMREGRKTC